MQLTLQAITFALFLLVFLERHRVTKELAATLGISATEASKIMSTPTWRTAAWQHGPAASLLRRATSGLATTNARASEASTTLLSRRSSHGLKRLRTRFRSPEG